MDAMRLPPPDFAAPWSNSPAADAASRSARQLLHHYDLLLLDEPTDHLDAESVEWLDITSPATPGLSSPCPRDRYFLDNTVAKWILELDRGRGYRGPATTPAGWNRRRPASPCRRSRRAPGEGGIDRELEWAKMALQRIAEQARLAAIEKMQELVIDEDEGTHDQIPPGPPLGDLVVRAEGLSKAYGDNLLFEDMTFNLPKGGIVGIIGPNGAGKTTLFKMIVGTEQPTSGTLTVGPTVKPAHVDQNRDALVATNTIFEEITGGTDYIMLGKQKVASRGYCARFNFTGTDQQKLVGSCSGGERNRIHLAKLLRSGGNLLLLDEPTNDLDVDTLRALEEALINFAGCAVVISHDRWFLDRIATHILAFEGDSKVVWCEGNFRTYEEQKRARLGEAADQPTRLKYRKLRG
ncbi:MAG: ATP-binding cassette domain-containing protein [Gemmataceae bacterium]